MIPSVFLFLSAVHCINYRFGRSNEEACQTPLVTYGECNKDNKMNVTFICGDNTPSIVEHSYGEFNCSYAEKGKYFDLSLKDFSTCQKGFQPKRDGILFGETSRSDNAFSMSSSNGKKHFKLEENAIILSDLVPLVTTNLSFSFTVRATSSDLSIQYRFPTVLYQTVDAYLVIGNTEQRIPYSETWSDLSTNTVFGTHTATICVKTTSYYEPIGTGIPQMEIRKIEYNPGLNIPVSCEKCPTNQTSINGICQPCPLGSYIDGTSCKLCDGYVYPLGTCNALPECTPSDFVGVLGECVGTQIVTYKKIRPCKGNRPSTTRPCKQCRPGFYLKNNECISCPSGTYKGEDASDQAECKKCPGGTIAEPQDVITSINNNTFRNFTTSCVSELESWTSLACPEPAAASSAKNADENDIPTNWITTSDGISTPRYHNAPVELKLHLHVSQTFDTPFTQIQITYTPNLQEKSVFSMKITTEEDITITGKTQKKDVKSTMTLPLFIIDEEIVFTFKHAVHNNDLDYVIIHSIILNTPYQDDSAQNNRYGAVSCSACAAGTFSEEGSSRCTLCPKGHSQDKEGQKACDPCPADHYSSLEGSTKCLACGQGMVGSADHLSCKNKQNTCQYTHNQYMPFDLENLLQAQTASSNFQISNTTSSHHSLSASSPKPRSYRYSAKNADYKPFGPYTIQTTSDTIYLSLCVNTEDSPALTTNCSLLGGQTSDGYSCLVTTYGWIYSLGRTMHWEVWQDDKYVDPEVQEDTTSNADKKTGQAGNYGVELIYEDGDYCFDEEGSYRTKSTSIKLTCVKPGDDSITTSPVLKESPSMCDYNYTWRTPHACRLCTEFDREVIREECVKGQRKAVIRKSYNTKTKADEMWCTGGVSALPILENMTLLEGQLEKVDVHAEEITVIEKCKTPVKVGVVTLIIILVVLGLVAVGVIFLAVCLCCKNRQLKFKVFQKDNVDIEKIKAGVDDPSFSGPSHNMNV
ncbi:hypothetical protein BLNAU_21779 [Blattamonas nauphoetae]|uniref:MRH domain-containing protein n=1 Tax=Blattamonas nauphoetae TaxID=2049346 RepID=A0ABQ9WX85_9EUKA|nr:hypothetical protein BLNAU_21779 [Blattamonas nauphoetae]